MDVEVLFKKGSFRFEKQNTPSIEICNFVSDTLWGSLDKVRFYQMKTTEYLPLALDPFWFSLHKGNILISTLALLHRQVWLNQYLISCYYIRYLVIAEQIKKASNHSTINSKNIGIRIFDNDSLRGSLENVFSKPNLLSRKSSNPDRAIFYSCVQLDNIRSVQMCDNFGFEKIRTCSSVSFSRFFPKKDIRVSKINDEEKPIILALLKEQYNDYNFLFLDHTFYIGDYFILKDENEILAGVQAIHEHWIIKNLPGFSGKLMQYLLPYIPFISRLFNPKDFHLLLFESIYVKPGYEDLLYPLFESVLANYNLNTAFIWQDNDSALFHALKNSGNLGLLDKLKSDNLATIVARFENVEDIERKQFFSNPAFLSAFDLA